jgi:hypothetical protein
MGLFEPHGRYGRGDEQAALRQPLVFNSRPAKKKVFPWLTPPPPPA